MRIVLIMLVVLLASGVVFANEQPAQQPATTEEISALRAEIADLRAALTALQVAQPERTISIGVMPIENAGRIPQVGNAFRQVMISALREAGIQAQESLDDETLRWVRRQQQLVREGLIDPRSAPRQGELEGVSHYLLATVTRYDDQDVEDVRVIAGVIVVKFGGGARVKVGSLVVDFRLVDAQTGVAEDSFRTEATVRSREFGAAAGYGGIAGYGRREAPLPEAAARAVARQAAERIAGLFRPAPVPAGQPQPAAK